VSDRPFVIEMEEAADPSLAPAVPDALPEGRAMQAAVRIGAGRTRSALGRFAGWAFGALFSFVLSVAAWEFVTGLLAANTHLLLDAHECCWSTLQAKRQPYILIMAPGD